MPRLSRLLSVRAAATAAALLFATAPAAQVAADGEADTRRGVGAAFTLTNDGFGLGAFWRGPLSETLTWTAGVSGRPGKDEREQQFFVGLFGDTVVPFKRNRFFLLPLEVGTEQRLFRDTIKPTFRPFLQVTSGPVIGYQWPYFEDLDGNGINEGERIVGTFELIGDGDFRLGVGGTLSFGAYVDTSPQSALGVRFGYSATYFFKEVELLEPAPDVEDPSRRYFGTPLLGVQFVRRLGIDD